MGISGETWVIDGTISVPVWCVGSLMSSSWRRFNPPGLFLKCTIFKWYYKFYKQLLWNSKCLGTTLEKILQEHCNDAKLNEILKGDNLSIEDFQFLMIYVIVFFFSLNKNTSKSSISFN